ncbi:Kelch repeat-containing protein [Actinomadura macra]|uniref:Kelch repeat-containing protein n=1 Tax=Actinomadura macra TaxID=46164 RepID=UPI00082DF09C|nr:kelch repeat-containing protein [Actinomadura macra]
MITGATGAARGLAAGVVPGRWSAAGELPKATWLATNTAVLLGDGTVLLAGGEDARRNAFGEASVYDPGTNAWRPTGALTATRRLHTLTRLADGRVLAAGGIGGTFSVPPGELASAEIYDPSTETWTPTGSMGQARYFHSANLLPDGRVLVAGGTSVRDDESYRTLDSAELFDPDTGTWSETGPMTGARTGHPAVSLLDGRVLAAGGMVIVTRDDAAGISHCEIYDPASGTWKPTGNLLTPRISAEAAPLPDGSVLLTGGGQGIFQDWDYSPYSMSSTERFDPATGRWSASEDMPWALSFHRAVPLPSGKVLVVGGTDTGCVDVGYRATFIYDPAARTWGIAGGLSVGRWDFAAVGLADGRVLAAGGIALGPLATASGAALELTATAELFTPDRP